MSTIDRFIEADESIFWKGRPLKRTVLLQSFAGIPIALVFGSIGIVSTLYFDLPLLGFPLILLVVACCLVILPPVWFLKQLPNTEYAMTNRRLLIKTGPSNHDIWSTELRNVKGIIVKTGISDKFLGTGKLYPITAQYPYEPKTRAYSRGGQFRIRKVYNLITGVYDEISEVEVYRKSLSHPHMEGINEPHKVKLILSQTVGMASISEEAPIWKRLLIIQKVGLGVGGLLVGAGLLVLAWGYLTGYTPFISYEAGYTIIDYVALVGYGFLFPGMLSLILTGMSLLYNK